MKKLLISLAVVLMMSVYSFAGTGQNVYGIVEGRTLGAVVTVARTDCGITSIVAEEVPGKDGSFVFESLANGEYMISVRNQKSVYTYSPSFITITIPRANKEIIFIQNR